MNRRRAVVLAVTAAALAAVAGWPGAVVGVVALLLALTGRDRSLPGAAAWAAVALLAATVPAQLAEGAPALLPHRLAAAGVSALAVAVVAALTARPEQPPAADPGQRAVAGRHRADDDVDGTLRS